LDEDFDASVIQGAEAVARELALPIAGNDG
jgi:hypothetical protein